VSSQTLNARPASTVPPPTCLVTRLAGPHNSAVYYEDIEVGYSETSAEVAVDRDEMVAYAQRNDPWPIHVDEDFARTTPAGGLIASFGYVVSLFFRGMHTLNVNKGTQAGFLGAVGWQVAFRSGVRGDDRLRVTNTVLSKRLASKGDRGVVVSRCDVVNQEDVVRVVVEVTSIYLCREASGEG
jgi:acyl dehydratase